MRIKSPLQLPPVNSETIYAFGRTILEKELGPIGPAILDTQGDAALNLLENCFMLEKASPNLKNLLLFMLDPDPDLRPNIMTTIKMLVRVDQPKEFSRTVSSTPESVYKLGHALASKIIGKDVSALLSTEGMAGLGKILDQQQVGESRKKVILAALNPIQEQRITMLSALKQWYGM
jgi:hypothetical protein